MGFLDCFISWLEDKVVIVCWFIVFSVGWFVLFIVKFLVVEGEFWVFKYFFNCFFCFWVMK